MFSTSDYYLASEAAYRLKRTSRDWKAVKPPGQRRRRIRNRLRLRAQATLPYPKHGVDVTAVA